MSKISRIFAAEFKNATFMSKQKEIEIRLDRRNYRKHGTENKRIIKKSLEELGAGRSIVIDAEGEIIAGNGVFEQAQELGIKTKIVETDGSELVVVKRTDLRTQDEKRKKLAVADNAASDSSEWANDLLREDWTKEALAEFGVTLPNMDVPSEEDVQGLFEEAEQKQDPNFVSIKIDIPRQYESDIEDIKEAIKNALQAWEGCVLK